MSHLTGRTVAFLATDGFEDSELTAPWDAVTEHGATAVLVSSAPGTVTGEHGTTVNVDLTTAEVRPEALDALVLPGGVQNADTIRLDEHAVALVRAVWGSGRAVGVICHGAWILADAGVLDGRTLTSFPSLRTDLRNAGASWVDEEVVVDDGLVSSRTPEDLPAFIARLVDEIADRPEPPPRRGVPGSQLARAVDRGTFVPPRAAGPGGAWAHPRRRGPGGTMRALQYRTIGSKPELVEVETPEPGPGQVRIKVTAAGACHSDVFVMELPAEQYVYGLPLTLGHEGVGVVDMLGEGVTGLEIGEPVAVYGPQGCGRCYSCSRGEENYCANAAALGIAPPGLGAPGSMAEYMIVPDPRFLVPLGDLDPVQNVALTDAGLTPYHAIKASLPKLVPGSTAVVIGAGGLGHVAIQILRAISPARVVALDLSEQKLELAREVGAHEVLLSEANAAEEIRAMTGGQGVEAVFDFVAAQPTIDLGRAVTKVGGDQVLVGVGAGNLPVGMLAAPWESSVRAPYWGSRSELMEVLELARRGLVHVETEVFPLDDAVTAYEKLWAGTLRGRAVVVP